MYDGSVVVTRGLCVILDAAETAVTGQHPSERPPRWVGTRSRARCPTDDLTPGGPAYEVMYLLDADDDAIPELRGRLQELGDSLVVVGGEGLWNVHVHVDDVGSAVEAGIDAGRPRRIRVTHFAEQLSRGSREACRAPGPRRGRRGRRRRARGAVPGGRGDGHRERPGPAAEHRARSSRPSSAAGRTRSSCCRTTRTPWASPRPQRGAAEEDGDVRVVVVPTRAQVQGIAAIAVHEPGRNFDSDVVHMTSAARSTRHGAVTVAARQAMTTAGPCEAGDVLGVAAG